MHTCWVSARLRERDDPSPNRVPRAEGAENRAASARAQLRAYVPSTSKVIECFTGLTYLLTYLLSDRVQFVRCLSPESDQRGLNCAASSDVGLGAGAHTHRRSWTRTRRREDSSAHEHPSRTGAHRGHLSSRARAGLTARAAARSNPHRRPRTLSFVADASNHSVRCSHCSPQLYFTCMQARAFETIVDHENPPCRAVSWRILYGILCK